MAHKKIGVIGLGSIGIRHATNLAADGHEVVGYDPDKGLGGQFNAAQSISDMLRQDLDAFVIASPSNKHADHLMRVWPTKKPVFVEKPIDINTELSQRAYREVTMVGYNLRFHPCVRKAKEWMADGGIGTPIWGVFFCCQYNDRPAYRRDGVILNWSHETDLALHIFGPGWDTGSSAALDKDQDVAADILIAHALGARSTVHVDYLAKVEKRGFIVVGSEGSIEADLPARAIRKTNEDWVYFDGGYDDDYIAEMRAFVGRIDGKETLGCTGDEALNTLRICCHVRDRAGLK